MGNFNFRWWPKLLVVVTDGSTFGSTAVARIKWSVGLAMAIRSSLVQGFNYRLLVKHYCLRKCSQKENCQEKEHHIVVLYHCQVSKEGQSHQHKSTESRARPNATQPCRPSPTSDAALLPLPSTGGWGTPGDGPPPAETLTASFIPPRQWPGKSQRNQ